MTHSTEALSARGKNMSREFLGFGSGFANAKVNLMSVFFNSYFQLVLWGNNQRMVGKRFITYLHYTLILLNCETTGISLTCLLFSVPDTLHKQKHVAKKSKNWSTEIPRVLKYDSAILGTLKLGPLPIISGAT